jgi:hypothetical protein
MIVFEIMLAVLVGNISGIAGGFMARNAIGVVAFAVMGFVIAGLIEMVVA